MKKNHNNQKFNIQWDQKQQIQVIIIEILASYTSASKGPGPG